MNNEQQELLNEAYEKYYATLIDSITFSERGKHFKSNGLEFNSGYPNYVHYSKEEFINKCKTNPEFSEKWGLKIEERELNLEERYTIARQYALCPKYSNIGLESCTIEEHYAKYKVPTKLITITYNDKTIESYESGR
jgi:hypothetical protein